MRINSIQNYSQTGINRQSFGGRLVLDKVITSTEHHDLYTTEDYYYTYHPYFGEKTEDFFDELKKHSVIGDSSGEIVNHFKLGNCEKCNGVNNTAEDLALLKCYGIFHSDKSNTKYIMKN